MAKEIQTLVDFTEIPHDSDEWELFCRDLLQSMGLYIDTPPNRGPDHGKDMLATETVRGKVSNVQLRWLVSCKHFATSQKSVNETDEQNLLERIKGFNADGFIGIYSTVVSSGLNHRLEQLRSNSSIADYRVLDYREIENRLVTAGYSTLLMRYFPASYARIRPVHNVNYEYDPLPCKKCGKDLLLALHETQMPGNIVLLYEYDKETSHKRVVDVYANCKGCDTACRDKQDDLMDLWQDVSDLVIPYQFLSFIFQKMDLIRQKKMTFTDAAFTQWLKVLEALAQKVCRETNAEEWERIGVLSNMDFS